MGCVYMLEFPDGKKYIGSTMKKMCYRLSGHKYNVGKKTSELYSHWALMGEPVVKILATANDEETIRAAEGLAVMAFNTKVPHGLNMAYGGAKGPLGVKLSDEVRRQMSERSKGRVGHTHSKEVRARISKGLTGRVLSQETKLKLSIAGKKRTASAETRAKMSASLMGNKYSLGTKQSDATKAKRVESIRRFYANQQKDELSFRAT